MAIPRDTVAPRCGPFARNAAQRRVTPTGYGVLMLSMFF
jgi:hypothetical protein